VDVSSIAQRVAAIDALTANHHLAAAPKGAPAHPSESRSDHGGIVTRRLGLGGRIVERTAVDRYLSLGLRASVLFFTPLQAPSCQRLLYLDVCTMAVSRLL
jgi:hypothetical protein